MKKLPPIEKVFEAWTAIVDGRVTIDEDKAVVRSSDDTKQYIVKFRGDLYSSDDNGTYWQGYAGYPVIAVLMLQGRLAFDRDEAELWRDVNWKELNVRFKNRYNEVVKEIASQRGINLEKSRRAAEKVMQELEKLPIEIKRVVN